jgi:hypothetical protein
MSTVEQQVALDEVELQAFMGQAASEFEGSARRQVHQPCGVCW